VYGVDGEIFRPANRGKDVIRQELNLPVSGHLIFYSSRVAPEKDGDTLLLALRGLVEAGRDVRILHCSGGHTEFAALAERVDVADRVISRPAVHPHRELADLYRAADLCVQASRAEGLGFSPLEALACEVPVVATAVGGLCETVISGETGWSYPPGDVDALQTVIADALDRPAEAARRAKKGRRLVGTRYDRRVVFDQLDAVVRAP
jgi:glycogen(starch) synthase